MARILGVHEDAAPAATAARFPGARWGGEFVARKGGGPLPESTTEKQLVTAVRTKARPYLEADGGCIVRIKTPMASVAKGNWDDRLAAVAAAVAGLDIILILWHEPEDDLKPGVFVPAFNRGRDVIKKVSPGTEVDYAGMSYQWRPGSRTTADAKAWAADLRADRYLLDIYFGDSFSSTYTLGTHPGRIRWHAEMIEPYDRPWGFGEWGRQAEPDRAAGFTADFEWLATDPVGKTCSLIAAWGTPGTEGNPGWLLDKESVAVVAAGFARLSARAVGGYRRSSLPGFLISERSGCLVADDLVLEHDQLLRALDRA